MTDNRIQTKDLVDYFRGKTAVITGAGRGIGRATAHLLGAYGARVVIAEIHPIGAECAREIQQSGGEACFIQTDVSDSQSVERLAEQSLATFGPTHILINNAILSPIASVLEMETELWDRVMAVNLRGTFLNCKFFLPGMLSQSAGVIINMISTDALPHMSAYMASKQGIAAFSRSLAGEVGDTGIQVVAFAPGFVDTPGLRAAGRSLAPYMQLDEQAFMNLSFHPAYQGAMPVEDAALATALLISRYRELYHGDQVDGYTILERAGVIASADAGTPANSELQPVGDPLATGDTRLLALEHAHHLVTILDETENEFNRLPLLVRPLARQGFKSKAGRPLAEWQRAVPHIIQALESASVHQLPPESGWIPESLSSLARYFHEVPAETARFTRDAETLKEITEISQQRENTVLQLRAALEACLRSPSTATET